MRMSALRGATEQWLQSAEVCRLPTPPIAADAPLLRRSIAVSSLPDAPLLHAPNNSNPPCLDRLVNSEKTRAPVAWA